MKTIRISAHTHRAIAEESIMPFRSNGFRQADGTWLIQLADDTYEGLLEHQLSGETIEDTILRVIYTHRGTRPN